MPHIDKARFHVGSFMKKAGTLKGLLVQTSCKSLPPWPSDMPGINDSSTFCMKSIDSRLTFGHPPEFFLPDGHAVGIIPFPIYLLRAFPNIGLPDNVGVTRQ